jgi:hypothetical protein
MLLLSLGKERRRRRRLLDKTKTRGKISSLPGCAA